MATMTDTVPGSGYGNPYVDALVSGCGWSGGPIRYFFGTYYAWFGYEQQAVRKVLQLYENVANVDFQEVRAYAQADMVEWLVDSSILPGVLGYHELPDPSVTTLPTTQPRPYG